ncbi:hypothetical protein V1477_003516, partial [Vespula maculifrons]
FRIDPIFLIVQVAAQKPRKLSRKRTGKPLKDIALWYYIGITKNCDLIRNNNLCDDEAIK